MNKFERVLSDACYMDILAKVNGFSPTSEGEVYVGSGDDVWVQLAEFAERVERAAITKCKEKLAEQEPICYLLGDPKDRPRVLSTEFMSRPNTFSVDAVITPVFERPMPYVSPTSDKAACVSESGEIDTQIKERHRSTKNHIPNAGKMVAPHGYRLVSLADIDTAIQRASVFDDGGDGADPESARSCIEILKSMISSKAVDSLEPRKEVVHDRHTGRELLYFPPVGESLYSMAQARKESFSLALSVDTKKVQALLQSYLDSLEGWQLVPKKAANDIEPDQFREAYRAVLEGAPKYEGK